MSYSLMTKGRTIKSILDQNGLFTDSTFVKLICIFKVSAYGMSCEWFLSLSVIEKPNAVFLYRS